MAYGNPSNAVMRSRATGSSTGRQLGTGYKVLSHSILSLDQYSGSIDDETLQRLKQLREQAAEIELLEAIPALDEALESL